MFYKRHPIRDRPRKILEKFKRHSSDIFRLSPIKNTECIWFHGKLRIAPILFQPSLADVVCNRGVKDYCPVACNNCNVNGMKENNLLIGNYHTSTERCKFVRAVC